MKVIFSRKGFDSSYGGCSSIILPKEMGSKMISFPIPETHSKRGGIKADNIIYVDLYNKSLKDILSDLNKEIKDKYHVDPEIQNMQIKDTDGSLKQSFANRKYAALGQSGAAAGHLLNQKIKKGDLFLFFSTYQETRLDEDKKIHYAEDKKKFHSIWGYMIVDDVFLINPKNNYITKIYYDDKNNRKEDKPKLIDSFTDYPGLKSHLHFKNRKGYEKNIKNIIICSTTFGTFNYTEELRLTRKDPNTNEVSNNLTDWKITNFWNNNLQNKITMTYNDKNIKKELSKAKGHLHLEIKAASIGQEFVIDNYDIAIMKKWLKEILPKKAHKRLGIKS